MILEVPLNYRAYFKRPRQPSWESIPMKMVYSGTIKEVDSRDTVYVAHVFNSSQEPAKVDIFSAHNPLKVIQVDGTYYVERFPVDQIQEVFGQVATKTDNWYIFESNSPLFGYVGAKNSEYHKHYETITVGYYDGSAPKDKQEAFLHLKTDDLKKWTEDKKTAVDTANLVFDTFVICDGLVYQKINEPVLKLIFDANEIALVVSEKSKPSRLNEFAHYDLHYDGLCFGLDEYDRAKQAFDHFAKTLELPASEMVQIEYVDPETITFRGDSDNLYRYALYVAKTLIDNRYGQGSLFEKLSHDATLAVYDLSVAVEKYESTSPELLRAIRGLISVYKRSNEISDVIDMNVVEVDGLGGVYWKNHYERFEKLVRGLDSRLMIYEGKDENRLDWNKRALDAAPMIIGDKRIFQITNMADVLRCNETFDCDLRSYADDCSRGLGELIAAEDFTNGRLLAVGFYPTGAPAIQEQIWALPAYSKNDPLFSQMIDYLYSSAPNIAKLEAELDKVGI